MLDTFKQLVASQFDAALCMASMCIDRCPESLWNSRVGNHLFCQVAFHALFYADFYLGPSADSFRRQAFHRDHEHFFRDYEELEDRAPQLTYDKLSIKTYVEHCRKKAADTIASETADSLSGPSGFQRRAFSRAELHVCNTRHLQHHAAQLSLRLRLDAGEDIPWIGCGWRDA